AGGRIRTGNQLSRLGIEVNRGKMALSENEVMLKTEEQYWQIISLKEKMKTLMEMEQLLNSFYKQANDAWQAGLINRNDVMKVSLKQSDLRINKLKLENGILLASMAFCQYLGLPLDTQLEFSDQPLPDQTPETLYIDPDQALKNREEYKLLQKSAEAETMQTKLTRGEYLPEAGIGIGALYYDLTDHSTTNAMAYASIKIPLSDWWGAAHSLKERKLKEQITLNNNRNQNELMLLQMQKTWNELNESYQKIQVVEEAVTQAEENLKINKDNYEAGIVNISDMLEAQTLLQQAREQLSEARMNYRVKRITYLQVTAR
ncbi:MAG: TolC family protein, partial [Bacteroidales bacterium]|nr:TolC family protein [Bacteroidales bacterium]